MTSVACSNNTTTTTTTNLLLLQLPVEAVVVQGILPFLSAPDVLSFLSTCRTMHALGTTHAALWQVLTAAQYAGNRRWTTPPPTAVQSQVAARQAYLQQAYCHALPAVRWYAVPDNHTAPEAREGHGMCRIGNYIVLTGGYTQDRWVYVKDIRTNTADPGWYRILAANADQLQWVYGASWTTWDDTRAICFGGFRAGGYSNETAQVAVLHVEEEEEEGGNRRLPAVRARWEIVATTPLRHYISMPSIARAYAATALWKSRYLMVMGGMQSDTSLYGLAVLDTATWTWYWHNLPFAGEDETPSPRHGCSLIADPKRGRLVLFGGGDGSDLLRSGQDFADVWQLDFNPTSQNSDTVTVEVLKGVWPWKWSRLHPSQPSPNNADNEDDDAASSPNVLSRTERLNLGRCHACHKISDDTCLLVFGSGRPSTNAVLGYRLDTDEFFRPTVSGPLPQARFTFASVFVPELGYLLVHGGYSTQSSDAITGMCALDCCPALQHPFQWWPVNPQAHSHPPVDLDRAGPTLSLETLVRTLNVDPFLQQGIAQTILETSVVHDPTLIAILRGVARGNMIVQRNEGNEDDDDDDDEEQEEESDQDEDE